MSCLLSVAEVVPTEKDGNFDLSRQDEDRKIRGADEKTLYNLERKEAEDGVDVCDHVTTAHNDKPFA